ncbi:MAG TPA: CoB--CoM heterodisulfide reductase iron-sulfur subunit A family protein [Desulfomonilaceae bacterium]|nr:CoB--CoM heterodisulfide reductase iron-sulfur subunit A family protein [Desulfomonilaceae bacterium]
MEMKRRTLQFDSLVVGGGIGGLTSALDLADQGLKVVVVEKEPSIGGAMIALSKVFPTLDCSSCITTPRMAAAAHHPNIEILTYTEVSSITRDGLVFRANLIRKPRYVNEDLCIGCRQCEYICPVDVPHEFEGGMGARKAVYVPFATAIPQKAVLDTDNCMLCGSCEKVCPTHAVDYHQRPEEMVLEAKSVILATGYQLSPKNAKKQYLPEVSLNVLTSLQTERLLAPHGPYGRVIRPSDGKIPDSVAYVQCAGSRDQSIGVPYCSRVCCMYAIKQAMLLSGALPLVEVTIYYMDIRAFGKGYEEFYQNAKAMGIEFVKAKVAKIAEDEDHNLSVRVELMEEDGRVEDRKHDLVVLSLGMLPGCNPQEFIEVGQADDGFVSCPRPNIAPALTAQEGVFVAGTASGPKDIVDTIAEAGSAAMEAANYLASLGAESTLAARVSTRQEEVIAEPAVG